jgi:ABC-type lipoprotein export system ATPase subunit
MHEEEGVDDRALASAVSFSSLNKTVSVHGKDKKILTNVSGSVRGDEIMAVMGTSGSGKTTLLEVLGGRNQLGVTGEVILGGMLLEKKYRKSKYKEIEIGA